MTTHCNFQMHHCLTSMTKSKEVTIQYTWSIFVLMDLRYKKDNYI